MNFHPKPVVFITANQSKHAEVDRLLAGIDVRWERLGLPRPLGLHDLEDIARARVRMAYEQLKTPCFLEATGLFLYEHDDAPGASFKRSWRDLGEAAFAKRFGGSHGVARVAVALAEGPREDDVRVWSGSIAGSLVTEPRGNGYGWANIWKPDGYDRTLGEMGASTYVVNMRALPYLALGDHLRGKRFTGTFEAHVTVRVEDASEHEAFRSACADLGVKHIEIELPRGDVPRQPMTASFHRGELAQVHEEVLALSRELVRRGLEVTRTKIEAHGPAHDVPESDEEATRAPSTSYFEFHIKLAIDQHADLAPLTALCQAHGAHLSRNAHKGADGSGLVERFVTLRVHRLGRASAEARFSKLCDAVTRSGVVLRNRIREYTVFDTNVSLDKGWLPESP